MGLVSKIVAVVLVALWPAVTSHSLLTHGGIIHVVHANHGHDEHDPGDGKDSHEHHADNHAFADGDYRSTSNGKLVVKPLPTITFQWVVSVISPDEERERLEYSPGHAPPGSTPQLLQQAWQFSNRTAIPARAPSLLS